MSFTKGLGQLVTLKDLQFLCQDDIVYRSRLEFYFVTLKKAFKLETFLIDFLA